MHTAASCRCPCRETRRVRAIFCHENREDPKAGNTLSDGPEVPRRDLRLLLGHYPRSDEHFEFRTVHPARQPANREPSLHKSRSLQHASGSPQQLPVGYKRSR